MIVEIEVGRDALEVQAVGGRVSAPEPPARPGAEVPPEVVSEHLLAVPAVGEARVADGGRPRGRRRRPPHSGVLPEVGHEQQEEGQGGEDGVGADEERGGGHRPCVVAEGSSGFVSPFRRARCERRRRRRRWRRRRTDSRTDNRSAQSFRLRLNLSLAPSLDDSAQEGIRGPLRLTAEA